MSIDTVPLKKIRNYIGCQHRAVATIALARTSNTFTLCREAVVIQVTSEMMHCPKPAKTHTPEVALQALTQHQESMSNKRLHLYFWSTMLGQSSMPPPLRLMHVSNIHHHNEMLSKALARPSTLNLDYLRCFAEADSAQISR